MKSRWNWKLCIVFNFFLFLCAAQLILAQSAVDPARVNEIAAMLPPEPRGLGEPITNRVAWDHAASNPALSKIIATAEKLSNQPVPELPDDLYLDYSRTGNRDRGQKVMFARADRLAVLTLAECMENRGRFLPAIQASIEAYARERSWTYPAHDGNLDVFEGRAQKPDLRATTLAVDLGTCDYLLGDKLPQATRQLLRENIRRRVLKPFRDVVEGRTKEPTWIHIHNNWNAVCLAGTLGGALATEPSRQERAWFIAAAEHYIQSFLAGFTPDGYCGEGIGYWNYGFGRFILLTEEIRQSTDGKVDFFKLPNVQPAALFAFHSEIVNGIYPSISDCSPGAQPDALFVNYVSQRLNVSAPGHLQPPHFSTGDLGPAAMWLFPEKSLPVVARTDSFKDSPLRHWFNDGGVLIERPDAAIPVPFAAVLQGGNNAESHNHNDVGSFSVILGRTMVICDPGGEVYTKRTFSAHRYDSKVINSYGHAVPIVAGKLQKAGADAKAVVLATNFTEKTDTLTFDIRSAYPVPDLTRLERTFTYHRDHPGLTVTDNVAFEKPESYETALITWGQWRAISPYEIEIMDNNAALRVKIETGGQSFEISAEEIDEHVHTPKKPRHLAITLKQPVSSAKVTLNISPAPISR